MNFPTIPILPAGTQTTCPYCGVGCGVRAMPQADGRIEVSGDESHPANRGRLCVKGSALGETLAQEGRLLYPKVRERGAVDADAWRRTSWDQALRQVTDGFRRIIDEHGPDGVALYVSGQFLTEDYYVANKLMKGYIGSANIDTNSRLCMSSAVAGHKRAFGADLVPVCYDDIELSDLIVLVGSNMAWCHPILFQRMTRIKEMRPEVKIVVIDPRRTATCESADLHLPIKAGTDVWLFNGLLSFLSRHGAIQQDFVDAHTDGSAQALAVAESEGGDLLEVARICGVDPEALLTFYRWFAATDKVITAFSQGVNQSSAGTDKVNSIINCHLLTGRIGRPGAGPFSLTGQPNAMGGREVGGLANMLAAHMELAEPAHRELVQRFWGSPAIAERPGLKAVELFEAIEAGRIKAVWIMATNPVVSLPNSDQVKRALARCELVVVSDVVEHTDTNACAHVLLPALAWGEKDGTVTNSERRISRQRAFLSPPGEARADWRMICEVAQRMGYAGFNFTGPHEIFDEHARLSAFDNPLSTQTHGVARSFNLSGVVGLGKQGFDALQPVQWPITVEQPAGTARLFADRHYAHPNGRARFIATPPRLPVNAVDQTYPFTLNTGRVRDQWHSMTRTGKSPKLADHVPEAFVDMHPQDALSSGVRAGGLARIATRWGAMVARVQHSGSMARGSVFVPIHWNAQFASDARVGALVNPVVDPISGEPEFKHTPAQVEEFNVSWYGFALSRQALAMDDIVHWTRIQGQQHIRYELAGRQPIADPGTWAREFACVKDDEADWLEYEDTSAGVYRAVHLLDERIETCIFISPRPDLPARSWLAGLFAKQRLEEADRSGLLLGHALAKAADAGPTVCSCFGVGRTTIREAIRQHSLTTAAQVTACVKAGGNCGSCVPEIKRVLGEMRVGEIADS